MSVQAQVINLMEKLQDEFNLSYVFIAHDLSIVRHISDRVGVMYLGKMAEIGTDTQIYDHPTHPYTQALLSAVPVPDPTAREGRERTTLPVTFRRRRTRPRAAASAPGAGRRRSAARRRSPCWRSRSASWRAGPRPRTSRRATSPRRRTS
ncbi:dipeptide ABC transporter ATP-binding protein [Streptomyces californicus]